MEYDVLNFGFSATIAFRSDIQGASQFMFSEKVVRGSRGDLHERVIFQVVQSVQSAPLLWPLQNSSDYFVRLSQATVFTAFAQMQFLNM